MYIKLITDIFTSIQSRNNIKKIQILLDCTYTENKIKKKLWKPLLSALKILLENNNNIENFNINIPMPNSLLMDYSKLWLNHISHNSALKILNSYYLDELKPDSNKYDPISIVGLLYKGKAKNDFICETESFMPIILSSLIKNFNKKLKKKFCRKILDCRGKIKEIKVLDLQQRNFLYFADSRIFVFNLLSCFNWIEKLELSSPFFKAAEIQVLSENFLEMKNLKILKVSGSHLLDKDLSVFLNPPCLESLIFLDMTIDNLSFKRLSNALKDSCLKEIVLNSKVFYRDCFKSLVNLIDSENFAIKSKA